MRRIVIVGGRGFFGRAVAAGLREDGLQPLIAARSGGDLRMDAEDEGSIRASLAADDVVIDAAGPFQRRTMRLLERCLAHSCDLIDLSDSLSYASRVHDRQLAIERAGRAVLTACSSVSAVSAALILLSGVGRPVRTSTLLAPATANTSTAATAGSLVASLERPIRVWRGGALVERRAFSERLALGLPAPLGAFRGGLTESADSLLLPLVWPSLVDADFWVDPRREVLSHAIAVAARHPWIAAWMRVAQPAGRAITKRFGARAGGFAIRIDGEGRRLVTGFVHDSHSYRVAAAPAVLAARRFARGERTAGLVAPDRLVDPEELVAWLARSGVRYFREEAT